MQASPGAAVGWNAIQLLKFWLWLAFDHREAGRATFAFLTEVSGKDGHKENGSNLSF